MSVFMGLSTVWCFLIFMSCVLVIPAWQSNSRYGWFDRISRGGLGAGALSVVTICVLGEIKCYNIISIAVATVATFALVSKPDGVSLGSWAATWPERALGGWSIVRTWAGRTPKAILRRMRGSNWIGRRLHLLGGLPIDTLCLLALLLSVIVLSFCSHLGHWNNVRFIHSDEYICLLRARQLLLNVDIVAKPLLFPALTSLTSLLSGVDPVHVVRTLAALVPFLLTLATGRVAFLLTGSLLSSSVAMYCMNVGVLGSVVLPLTVWGFGPQPALTDLIANVAPSLESEMVLFFLLLWMAVLLKQSKAGLGIARSTVACGILLGASSFLLLLVAPFVGLAGISKRPRVFLPIGLLIGVVGSTIWQMRAPESSIEALQYVPCMLGLLAGVVSARLEVAAVFLVGLQARAVVAALVIAFALFWFPPKSEATLPLEYDSIARATNSISHQFPHQHWSIAAPVEQFAEVYSLGGFEDLAALVNSASSSDAPQSLTLGEGVDDLFIFVEKVPFTSFLREPNTVPFLSLTDSTYRNYRSPAGRASLEVRAMQLCERYKEKHKNMTIFFEDDDVRVYHLSRGHDPVGAS